MKPAFHLLLGTVIALQCVSLGGCARERADSEPVPESASASIDDDSVAENNNEQSATRELAAERSTPAQSALPTSESKSELPPITREPVYQSATCYAVIAIGPERRKLLWTAADLGSSLVYVDLNGNGDLTETEEAINLRETTKIGKTRNWLATISEIRDGEDVHTDCKLKFSKTDEEVKGVFSMKLWGWDESTVDADLIPLTLPTDASVAPVVHFNGPLVMGPYRSRTELPIGKEVDFYSQVGTKGDGIGTFAAISNTSIPPDAHPIAEFQFPHRDPAKPAFKVKTYLTVRC